MELYQAYTDYHGMMDLIEDMYRFLAREVCGSTTITYNGTEIDLGKPFRRLTMVDAIKERPASISTGHHRRRGQEARRRAPHRV